MPVILTSEGDRDAWLTAAVEEALKLQRSLPNEAVRVVATERKTRSQHRPLAARVLQVTKNRNRSGGFRRRMGAGLCPRAFFIERSY
jgi:hypothetical protein